MSQSIRHSAVSFEGEARFHLGLQVRDLERSIRFYETIFERPPTKVRPGYAKFEPEVPPLNFTLNQQPDDREGAGKLSHMGIQLKDTGALARAHRRLEKEGLVRSVEKETACCYALQDKFWVKDPDGNDLEFFVVLEKDAKPAPAEEKVCCTG